MHDREPIASQSERKLTAAERKWITRLQRTLAAQPSSLVIYCHGYSSTVLDRDAYEAADDFTMRDAILNEAPGIDTAGWIAGDF